MERPISVGNIVLEITRRCNMRCDHCMRGEAEALDMSFEVIDKLFESGLQFNEITITGGEPSLFPKAIQYFADKLEHHQREIGSFYVKTNGKHESPSMAMALLKLYFLSDNQDGCTLDVSRDQYHEGFDPQIYQGLGFYNKSDDPHSKDHYYKNTQILSEGIAMENGLGKGEQRNSEFVFDEYDDGSINLEMLQVAANGNVCGQCDISFDREDEDTYGNILKKDILEIISEAYDREQEINEAA